MKEYAVTIKETLAMKVYTQIICFRGWKRESKNQAYKALPASKPWDALSLVILFPQKTEHGYCFFQNCSVIMFHRIKETWL